MSFSNSEPNGKRKGTIAQASTGSSCEARYECIAFQTVPPGERGGQGRSCPALLCFHHRHRSEPVLNLLHRAAAAHMAVTLEKRGLPPVVLSVYHGTDEPHRHRQAGLVQRQPPGRLLPSLHHAALPAAAEVEKGFRSSGNRVRDCASATRPFRVSWQIRPGCEDYFPSHRRWQY